MNILIISNVYYPEPIPRIHELAVDLHKKGYKVLVLTAFPSYPEGKVYKGYRQRLYSWEILNGVRILRVWSYCDHSRSFMRRVVSYLSFAFFASIFGPLFCGKSVLMAVKGEAQNVILKYQAGVVCSPENPGEMVDAVRYFYDLSVEERERMGANARKAFLKHYERGILVEKYISLLLQIADGLEVRR